MDLPTLMKKYWDNNTSGHSWPPREDYYEHYVMWSALCRPKTFLEIGVMYGWSTMAVLLGSPRIRHAVLIDSELYKIPVTEAKRRVIEFCIEQGIRVPDVEAIKADTTKLEKLGFDDQYFDLSHVDGEHGEDAVYHDLCLVAPCTKHAIIVDDLSLPGIKAGADRFLAEHPEWEALIHKDHQTHYVMWRR